MKQMFKRGVVLTLGMALTLAGCKPNSEKTVEDEQDTHIETPAEKELTVEEEIPESNNSVTFKDFDWNTVPQSSVEIGEFPYITAPNGFIITDNGHSSESKTGYSELKEFDKRIMYTGSAFYNAEGRVAELYFRMKDKNATWEQYRFDKSVQKYLEGIGAKLIAKMKLTGEQKDALNKEDRSTVYNYIIGDSANEPIKYWALNHKNGKIMFQVFSNSASGEIAVVKLEGFEQTIKAPTAMQ